MSENRSPNINEEHSDQNGSEQERPAHHDQETLRKANRYFFSKVVANVLLIVVGATLIGLFLREIQRQASYYKQKQNSDLALTEVITTLSRNNKNAEDLTRIYHEGNQQVLNDIDLVLSNGMSEMLASTDNSVRSDVMKDLADRAGIYYLFVLSREGVIVTSPDPDLYGVNPAVKGFMTQENINAVLKSTERDNGTIRPVLVKNTSGTFYFYSKPYKYMGEKYMLVAGMEANVLDDRTEVLTDVSTVLSRTAVINNGFMFAVNKKDNLFLYYKNGEDILTGQNAINSGLSEKALDDGYSGIETIHGQKYFCVSRTFGDQTVICASASTDEIYADDHFVLFWTILGFSIIMILCLSYAIIVRNDFVRHSVQTDRFVLKKDSDNPVYFDKSIFGKVFPLMLTGVMTMYGISFYTQTLLEVTQGIEKSKTALQEVSGRYEESQETREILYNYNVNHALSTAKLLSFIVEEDTAFLNAESDRYHSVFDENGNRVYLTDDEGNRLKSIQGSAFLQQLCDQNNLSSIYVFDEDGHTIATNTANWFFTLSNQEGTQSYPFREILEGKTDSFIQEMMTDELGFESQFIGTACHYYTSVDEDGNTVYVPRSTYEQSAAEGGMVNHTTDDGITRHNSLIQIELNKDLSEQLLESTDVASVLSTSMLSGGAIVMFDSTEEHKLVYSPIESSIGRTAAELGVSPNAFNGFDYYGFNRVNGVTYFQYYRYQDGYYIATAIPKNSMYLARGSIALLTAVICFVLILFLSMTVTLTNKEEERLYEAMSSEQAEKSLNSAIFNIVLPSGRQSSTTQASARWDNRRISWSEKSPEQKLVYMIGMIMIILMLYILWSARTITTAGGENTIIGYIISGNWDRTWNVFALSSCALVLMATGIVISLFRIPVRIITSLLGARGETLGHLLLSVMKYGGTIGAMFYCLYLVGMDATNLLAGVGVLSLVVGLGAQSLIKDILAGIFIVFEGEFRVGDIVTISDFRGTVLDIGLRTTKIMAGNGNIKIFNNSEITGVLNMTKEISVASATIDIEYGQDLDYVDAVLERELPLLKEKNKAIVSGPTSLGVSALGASGVSITVIARCTEQNVRSVNRFLNRELLQIFYRNDINVPFPNVTISQLDPTARKTVKDLPVITEESEEEKGEEKGEQK